MVSYQAEVLTMYDEVRNWMLRNARPVELALWRCHFEGGSPEALIEALAAYQNEDGGFGHALEADNWNPGSTPIATWTAIKYMLAVGFDDMTHPIYQGVWQYLASGKDREDYGWRFSVPENDNWPRAPWWSYGEKNNQDNFANVTVGLAAFILKYGQEDSELFHQARSDAQRLLALLMDKGTAGEALEGYDFLLAAMWEKGVPVPVGAEEMLLQRQNAAIGRDPAQWKNYVPRPSRFIHDAKSPLYRANEDIVQAEVAYLKEIRQSGGVWPITWKWFGMEQYDREFAISENWWKGLVAIENMLFLKAFDKGE